MTRQEQLEMIKDLARATDVLRESVELLLRETAIDEAMQHLQLRDERNTVNA